MYTGKNFRTKKALKEAVASGAKIDIFQPNDYFGRVIDPNGTYAVEGPHSPAPHSWYATVTLKDGYIVKVK